MPVQFNTEPDVLDSAPYDTCSRSYTYYTPHYSYNSGSNYAYSDDGTRSSEIYSFGPNNEPKFVGDRGSKEYSSVSSSKSQSSVTYPINSSGSGSSSSVPKKHLAGKKGSTVPSALRKDHPKYLPEIEQQKDKGIEIRLLREQNEILRRNGIKFINEIEELEIRNNKLEAENSNLKFKTGTDTDKSSAGTDGNVNYFQMGDAELQRRCLEMGTIIRQLNADKDIWMHEAEGREKEIKELKQDVKDLLHDIDLDETAKSKKKTWYGAKKKHKLGEAAQTANELRDKLDIDTDMELETATLDKARNKSVKKSGALAEHQRNEILNYKRQLERLQDQIKMMNEERVRLEKDKAKFEGETMILQKERWADKDRLSKLETHNELLKNQQRHAATETALTYSRAIQIPLPDREGHSELDRLRVMVQLQEDALRRVTVQRDQLVDMMDQAEGSVANALESSDGKRSDEDISRLNKQLLAISKEKSEAAESIKRLRVVVTNLEEDNKELKKTIQHLSHNLSKSAQINYQVKQKQAVMIGQALTANEDLAAQVAKMSAHNVDELMSANGDIKTVFTGRTNESASKYALNKKLYPAVTAKRYHETNPVIEKGRLITSVAQTDPMMITIATHESHPPPSKSTTTESLLLPPPQPRLPQTTLQQSSIPKRNSMSSTSSTTSSSSDTLSSMSYTYTYVEEEVIVPKKVCSPRRGIQTIPGGHQGTSRGGRSSIGNNNISVCGPAAVNTHVKYPHDDYESIAKDIHGQNLAAKALKAWNADHGARRQLV